MDYDQFCITLSESEPLGRKMLAALEQTEDLAWEVRVGGRQHYLYSDDGHRDKLLTAFLLSEEPRRPVSEPMRRLGFRSGGPAFTQVGDDLQQALSSTKAVLVVRDHGQLHVLCSDDSEAFGKEMLRMWELKEMVENFTTTGRFERIIINASA